MIFTATHYHVTPSTFFGYRQIYYLFFRNFLTIPCLIISDHLDKNSLEYIFLEIYRIDPNSVCPIIIFTNNLTSLKANNYFQSYKITDILSFNDDINTIQSQVHRSIKKTHKNLTINRLINEQIIHTFKSSFTQDQLKENFLIAQVQQNYFHSELIESTLSNQKKLFLNFYQSINKIYNLYRKYYENLFQSNKSISILVFDNETKLFNTIHQHYMTDASINIFYSSELSHFKKLFFENQVDIVIFNQLYAQHTFRLIDYLYKSRSHLFTELSIFKSFIFCNSHISQHDLIKLYQHGISHCFSGSEITQQLPQPLTEIINTHQYIKQLSTILGLTKISI